MDNGPVPVLRWKFHVQQDPFSFLSPSLFHPSGILRVIAHVFLPALGYHLGPQWLSVAESVLGSALPAGFLWLGGFLFEKLRHKEGLGLGDVKMMAMFGAFLGLRATLLTLILGSVAGSILGLIYIRVTKKDAASYQLPFGTFLGFAGIFVALVGEQVIRWYVGML